MVGSWRAGGVVAPGSIFKYMEAKMKYLVYILLIASNVPYVKTFDVNLLSIGFIVGILFADAANDFASLWKRFHG